MLQVANGISAIVQIDGAPVEVDEHGWIEVVKPCTAVIHLEHTIELMDESFGFVLQMNGQSKEVRRLKIVTRKNYFRYTRRVTIFQSLKTAGHFYTSWPDNAVFLAQVGNTGQAIVHRVGLVAYNGKIYLNAETEYEGQGYRADTGKTIFPGLEYWSELGSELGEFLGNRNADLPAAKNIPSGRVTADGLRAGEARVVWYNSPMGMGVAVAPQLKPVRVKSTALVSAVNGGLPRLSPGQLIRFSEARPIEKVVRQTDSGRPRKPTTLDYDLIGVEPIS